MNAAMEIVQMQISGIFDKSSRRHPLERNEWDIVWKMIQAQPGLLRAKVSRGGFKEEVTENEPKPGEKEPETGIPVADFNPLGAKPNTDLSKLLNAAKAANKRDGEDESF